MRCWFSVVLALGLVLAIPGCKCGREASDDPNDTLKQVSEEGEAGDPTMLEGLQEDDAIRETSQELEELPPEPPEADGDGAGLEQ